MKGMGRICLNWRVLAGLAAVGVGIWVIAPQLIWKSLPILLLAACPLSMLLMMRGMRKSMPDHQSFVAPTSAGEPVGIELAPDPKLAELKTRLTSLQVQQEALSRQISELENANPRPSEQAGT